MKRKSRHQSTPEMQFEPRPQAAATMSNAGLCRMVAGGVAITAFERDSVRHKSEFSCTETLIAVPLPRANQRISGVEVRRQSRREYWWWAYASRDCAARMLCSPFGWPVSQEQRRSIGLVRSSISELAILRESTRIPGGIGVFGE
jgi:hypothetical protein